MTVILYVWERRCGASTVLREFDFGKGVFRGFGCADVASAVLAREENFWRGREVGPLRADDTRVHEFKQIKKKVSDYELFATNLTCIRGRIT